MTSVLPTVQASTWHSLITGLVSSLILARLLRDCNRAAGMAVGLECSKGLGGVGLQLLSRQHLTRFEGGLVIGDGLVGSRHRAAAEGVEAGAPAIAGRPE